MRRRLSQPGSGWAVFLPKVIIELLGINPETDKIEMEVENKVLKIKKSDKSE